MGRRVDRCQSSQTARCKHKGLLWRWAHIWLNWICSLCLPAHFYYFSFCHCLLLPLMLLFPPVPSCEAHLFSSFWMLISQLSTLKLFLPYFNTDTLNNRMIKKKKVFICEDLFCVLHILLDIKLPETTVKCLLRVLRMTVLK